MCSVTITDASGRTLSGQTIDAFLISMAARAALQHGPELRTGRGPDAALPGSDRRAGTCRVSVYPNAGLPDQMGEYRETPEVTAKLVGEFMANGWVNVVGGCCGTTPEHIAALAKEAGSMPTKTDTRHS
jgi:5-methyltetrahydrofolate--homocysteine methyltransferase